jgi:glycosyltransferase involved in cell wall biosynthesis
MHESKSGSADIAYIGRDRMDATSTQLAQVKDCDVVVASSQKEPKQAKYPQLCGGTRLKGEFAEGSADQPLVTVITAVLNGQPYVQGCLESILRQDYPNIEHILIDGGSSDGTVDVLRQYDDRVALWTSEPNGGLYDAWNKALPEARGEWICFIGIDDELLPGAVSAYMALAARNPEAEYLNSLVRMVHHSGYERTFGRSWKWKEFSKWMRWAQVGTMHRRSLLNRLGPYDLSFGGVGDYEFLLRARSGLKAAYIPVETAMMRWGGVSDKRKACADATRAKIVTGGRNALMATIEHWIMIGRFYLRPLRRRYYLRPLRSLAVRLSAR